jgi:hypothetical protein
VAAAAKRASKAEIAAALIEIADAAERVMARSPMVNQNACP